MLLELQKLDLEVDEIRSSKESIKERVEEANQVLFQLQEDLEEHARQLNATVELQQEKDRERQELEERYKKSKGRLTKVTNAKEYSAIELEIENTKRLTTQIEEDLVQLMEVIDTAQLQISDKQQKIEGLREQIDAEGQKANQHIGEIEGRLAAILSNRDTLAVNIRKEIIRRYSFIRSRRDGVAIVAARDGYCQGCYMQLPPQLYIELQRCSALQFCPSCQRILFFEGRETSTEPQAS